ncbi:MAG TPA: hypothetical protein VK701_00410 [Solirubrobacteraceae bacterium]|jgi:hypothetical protein|nr:hypothetical protein [Solirubrobacteraceae bacterium]
MTILPDDKGRARGTPDTLRDTELPILKELEADLAVELRALAPPVPRRARGHALRNPARVARRVMVLVALLSLVGASALAGRSVFGSSHESTSATVLLSSGGHGSERWQLEAYLHEGAACYALFLTDTLSSVCGTPEGSSVRVTSALSPTRRFVVGFARGDVARVSVRIGHRALVVFTHPVSAAPGARRARLPVGLRWFATSLSEEAARTAPALVTARDKTGHVLGSPVLDCSLGGNGAVCQGAAGVVADEAAKVRG